MLSIAKEAPDQKEVARLLQLSDEHAQSLYPAESNHLIDVEALSRPNVSFFIARWNGTAVGCGALVVDATASTAELKRMFVDPATRGRGVARSLLERIENEARSEGLALIQLETGIHSIEALALYKRCGYRERGPFGSYLPDPLSVFMEKTFV
jgi:putative acetyltransferase